MASMSYFHQRDRHVIVRPGGRTGVEVEAREGRRAAAGETDQY